MGFFLNNIYAIWKLHFWGFPEMFGHQKKVVNHQSGQAKNNKYTFVQLWRGGAPGGSVGGSPSRSYCDKIEIVNTFYKPKHPKTVWTCSWIAVVPQVDSSITWEVLDTLQACGVGNEFALFKKTKPVSKTAFLWISIISQAQNSAKNDNYLIHNVALLSFLLATQLWLGPRLQQRR